MPRRSNAVPRWISRSKLMLSLWSWIATERTKVEAESNDGSKELDDDSTIATTSAKRFNKMGDPRSVSSSQSFIFRFIACCTTLF